MIVVAGTTPIRHLIAIAKVDLLRKLYGTVTVPRAVWNELQAESTPASVKEWLSAPPAWLQVVAPRSPISGTAELSSIDAGEREAIGLTMELAATLLLVDDRDARKIALRLQVFNRRNR